MRKQILLRRLLHQFSLRKGLSPYIPIKEHTNGLTNEIIGRRSPARRVEPSRTPVPTPERFPLIRARRRIGGLWHHAGGVLCPGGHCSAVWGTGGGCVVHAIDDDVVVMNMIPESLGIDDEQQRQGNEDRDKKRHL